MKHLFVPYELAVMAKEKGFDEPCLGYYEHNSGDYELYIEQVKLSDIGQMDYLAPLYQQLVDWFREKHRISITIDCDGEANFWINIYPDLDLKMNLQDSFYSFPSYYEALETAITEAFKLI